MPTTKIRQLNDALRVDGKGGRIMFTGGLAEASPDEHILVLGRLRRFKDFHDGNDPHQEHDWGSFKIGPQLYNWKIDYYDLAEQGASPNPADPKRTVRILTVYYAEDA